MSAFRALLLLGFALMSAPFAARAGAALSAAGLTVAVADFSGSDRDLGVFLADSLLTDLSRSDKLRLLERRQIRQALSEIKLQSTGLVEPGQVKRLGRMVGADRLVVGGYLVRAGQMLVNARVLDVATGCLVPGAGAHAGGATADVAAIAHTLARQVHRGLAGSDLPGDSDEAPATDAVPAAQPSGGLVPAGVRPSGVVRERDLAALAARLARLSPPRTAAPVTITRPDAPVSRLRAITALAKLLIAPAELPDAAELPAGQRPPDMADTPAWGLPYVAAAMERDWWPADRPLRPRDNATWAFMDFVLARLGLPGPQDAGAPIARRDDEVGGPADPSAYTGLVIDARDCPIRRSMSLRILDETGRVVYPEAGHLPGDDYLQDHGMASYYQAGREARRAGERPLVVRALDVAGPGRDQVVVSNATAERVRRENQRGRFLWRWRVAVLVDRGD